LPFVRKNQGGKGARRWRFHGKKKKPDMRPTSKERGDQGLLLCVMGRYLKEYPITNTAKSKKLKTSRGVKACGGAGKGKQQEKIRKGPIIQKSGDRPTFEWGKRKEAGREITRVSGGKCQEVTRTADLSTMFNPGRKRQTENGSHGKKAVKRKNGRGFGKIRELNSGTWVVVLRKEWWGGELGGKSSRQGGG